eukprot:GHVU01223053.1.p1 GENE.GHVU01223053.1~~GHVU01223053.1.p1  ORF type:complete len:413 (+),score=15.46 GHVU01223053.1:319-1557(+)
MIAVLWHAIAVALCLHRPWCSGTVAFRSVQGPIAGIASVVSTGSFQGNAFIPKVCTAQRPALRGRRFFLRYSAGTVPHAPRCSKHPEELPADGVKSETPEPSSEEHAGSLSAFESESAARIQWGGGEERSLWRQIVQQREAASVHSPGAHGSLAGNGVTDAWVCAEGTELAGPLEDRRHHDPSYKEADKVESRIIRRLSALKGQALGLSSSARQKGIAPKRREAAPNGRDATAVRHHSLSADTEEDRRLRDAAARKSLRVLTGQNLAVLRKYDARESRQDSAGIAGWRSSQHAPSQPRVMGVSPAGGVAGTVSPDGTVDSNEAQHPCGSRVRAPRQMNRRVAARRARSSRSSDGDKRRPFFNPKGVDGEGPSALFAPGSPTGTAELMHVVGGALKGRRLISPNVYLRPMMAK